MSNPVPLRVRVWNRLMRLYCRLLVALVLYVLSTGPMYWTCYEAYYLHGSEYVAKLYLPIVLACENEYIADWFTWYVELWIL